MLIAIFFAMLQPSMRDDEFGQARGLNCRLNCGAMVHPTTQQRENDLCTMHSAV